MLMLGQDGDAGRRVLSPAEAQQGESYCYTAMHNALGLPATVVPIGLNQAGLPLSIQVSAAEFNDHLTLAVAKQLERPFGGWTAPFRTDDSYGFY